MIALAAALMLSMQGSPAEQPGPGDVDLLPKLAAPDPGELARQQELEGKLQTRRTMLQYHQIGGMLTLATLGATVVFGQLNYNDKYGGGGDTGRWYDWL